MYRRTISVLLCISLIFVLPFSLSGCNEKVEANFVKGIIKFTNKSTKFGGTATITNKGAKIDTSVRSALLTCGDDINFDLNKNGLLNINLMNTTDLKELVFSFITKEDTKYTSFKSVTIPIAETKKFKDFTVDLSAQYGWMGSLMGIKISSNAPTKGEMIIKSVIVKKGGAHYLPLSIGPEEILYTFKQRAAKGIGMAPDGILGQWRNADGTMSFVGSNLGKVFKSIGSESDPFKTVKYSNSRVENVDPTVFRYASIAQVYKDPASKLLIGITHLEETLDAVSSTYVASIAISTSSDDGDTWQYIGQIVTCNIPNSEVQSASRDAGNGTMIIKDGYMYIYIADMDLETTRGLSVSRAKLSDVVEAAKAGKVTKFNKWYNNEWTEPGLGGKFSEVLTSGDSPNFCYIQYNTILKKYIMVTCTAPYYSSNDGDIAIYLSDVLTNFANPKYFIACGSRGEQYPTMISFEADSQTSSGKEFYIYYCSWNAKGENGVFDWQKLWGSSNYIRRKVTVNS